jgi:hypothetical protein
MVFSIRCRVLVLACLVIGVAADAAAQLSRVGDARVANTQDTVFGGDAAYDPVNHVYLVVMAREQGDTLLGSVLGTFVNTSGDLVGSPFVIRVGARANFARAAYSPDVSNGAGGRGGFLVTWTEPFTGFTYSHLAAYPYGVVSSTVNVVNPGYNGPAEIAYSTGSQAFLIAWESKSPLGGAAFARVSTAGVTVGPSVPLASTGSSGVIWNSNTSVVWNPTRGEFGVLYATQGSPATARLGRVSPTGVILDTPVVASLSAPPIAAALQFNPSTGNYVAVWADSGTGVITGAELSGTGTLIASGAMPSTIIGSQNGIALSYNSTSGTFLLIGFTQMMAVEQVKGLELNKHGAPNSPVIDVTALPLDSNYFAPRATARSDADEWLVDAGSLAHYVQVVRTATVSGGSERRLDGCYAPDPFAAMGGGTCYDDGWLPPGMTPPTGATTPPTSPPPSSSMGNCSTPDPFSAMGGGTCYNGGWLPPGMSPPSTATAPPPPNPPAMQTPPPPSDSTAGCATPDPFVEIGGGTCYNGGWLPPGMAPPDVPSAPPALPPPTSPTGCTTPDPFVAMGGGTCYNGGWLPPGMVIK